MRWKDSLRVCPQQTIAPGWYSRVVCWLTWHRKQQLPDTVPTDFAKILGAVASFADPVLSGQANGSTWQPGVRAWLN
jgi:hypothetical protein